jgi:branched-chain amino acid transport system permease protein
MATMGFGIIIYRIVLGTPFLGAADGINDVPGFHILPFLTVSGSMKDRISNYYIAWAVIIIGMVLLLNLVRSRAGRALRSLHGNEEAANAMGINVSRYKLRAFVLSAVFASLAGSLMTHYNAGIGPGEAGVMRSVRYVAIVAVGGMDNLWGSLVMSFILNFLSLRGVFGSYDDAVFGTILVLVMALAPGGVLRSLPVRVAVSWVRDKLWPRITGSKEKPS